MHKDSLFFSLRWKLAILFSSFFLILLSLFSYYSYLNAKAHFKDNRKSLSASHDNIIQTLAKDSFLTLEQFAELVAMVNVSEQNDSHYFKSLISHVDDKWPRWELTWDIENITFFDKAGALVKFWGESMSVSDKGVKTVLSDESPKKFIHCPNRCFQQVIVPVMNRSEVIGALSIARSFSDMLIKYNKATHSDIGILLHDTDFVHKTEKVKSNGRWQYKLLSITHPEVNADLFAYASTNFVMEQFVNQTQRIRFRNSIYEIHLLRAHQQSADEALPIFLVIDDISAEVANFDSDLKQIWLYSILGMILAILLMLALLHLFFRRIASLSIALPLLSQKKFDEFRKLIPATDQSGFGSDEIDKLNQTALVLSDQLETLEQNMHSYNFSLLEKSQELAKERDFIRQLIDLAPIIIIIQKVNGIILSINYAGVEALEKTVADGNQIVGKVFDTYIPESDVEHLNKLNRLRNGDYEYPIQQDGQLLTGDGKTKDISWVHKLLSLREYNNESVIFTLGIDISERKISEARNIRMAYYDYLTGLGNRRKFHEEFAQKLAFAERYNHKLALLYMDLDRFKEINDLSGHKAGDNFLKMVANILKNAIRATDLLCRLGGDEFTILMPYTDIEGLENIANKINVVLKSKVFNYSGKSFYPSTSIGIAVYPLHGSTVNDLMANADLAMYRAKELGRGQYHLFDPEYDYRSKSNQIVHWRKVLEEAIRHDKFILVYQPILDIKTNTVSHFECLVRLQLEDGKVLMPSEFVFRAEELGLISKIDRIVLEKTLLQHAEFNRHGKDFRLSINISRRTFDDPTIFKDFSRLLDNPEIDKTRIIFEITDTTSVTNVDSTNDMINRIRNIGCVLALNNFGIEYPSLNYLKNAPIDYVKIDGALIRQIDKNTDDKAFVKALTEVAQAFGKKTVAEFVENENILNILKEFGIDYAQGYFIGKPESF